MTPEPNDGQSRERRWKRKERDGWPSMLTHYGRVHNQGGKFDKLTWLM